MIFFYFSSFLTWEFRNKIQIAIFKILGFTWCTSSSARNQPTHFLSAHGFAE
jgi:hypothetical protein